MAEIGTITGIVGTLTGTTGAIMGYLGYRRSAKNKILDMRLQLRREVNVVKSVIEPLPGTMAQAKQSHTNVLAAIGLGRSGNQQLFDDSYIADEIAVKTLAADAAKLDRDYSALNIQDLEALLSEVHRLQLGATRYASKYSGILTSDDSQRAAIRSEHTTLAAARMQKNLLRNTLR